MTIRTVGHMLNLALENLSLKEQVIVDPLTKVYNRACFGMRLKEEIEKSRRYKTPFSLLLLDIDNFKHFNNNYGHQAGDEVLRIVARVLRNNTRSSDRVFRYGGEEFAVYLQNTGDESAAKVAERVRKHIYMTINTAEKLRQQVKNSPLLQGEDRISITVSIGISVFSGENANLTYKNVVKRSDESLFCAKEMGRDRVEVVGKKEEMDVLIVDDEAEYTKFLGRFFKDRGYNVVTANSGKEALSILQVREFDIMLLDLKMPGITGLDVLKRVPEIKKKMKVIILSAIGDDDIRKMSYEYGACEYLQKPISIEYLNKHFMMRILEMRAL